MYRLFFIEIKSKISGVTAGLLEKTTFEGERAARIELGTAESESETEDEVEEIPAQPMPFCTICFGTCRYNYKGREEFLLSCAECGTSFHPACIKMQPEKALRCMEYPWQCIECKTCRECGELITGDSGPAGGACCEYCDKARVKKRRSFDDVSYEDAEVLLFLLSGSIRLE